VSVADTDSKALRSDARRNRERILGSARMLLARDGVDASVEEITRDAGVGMGTLYRHFPTKADLIDAVLADTFDEIVRLAEEAAAEEDAWAGFTAFLEHALELHAENRGLKDALAAKGYDVNFTWGMNRHGQKMGGAILPEMMRWLWRDAPVSTDPKDTVERSFK